MSYIDKIISITACQQVLFLFLFSLCFIYNKSYLKGAFIHEYDGALLPCSEGEIYISLTGNLCETTWSFKMDSLQTYQEKINFSFGERFLTKTVYNSNKNFLFRIIKKDI